MWYVNQLKYVFAFIHSPSSQPTIPWGHRIQPVWVWLPATSDRMLKFGSSKYFIVYHSIDSVQCGCANDHAITCDCEKEYNASVPLTKRSLVSVHTGWILCLPGTRDKFWRRIKNMISNIWFSCFNGPHSF